HQTLVTIEDSAIVGGAGSAVLEVLNQHRLYTPCLRLGLSDNFPSHGTREQVFEEYGLNKSGILNSISDFLQN
ncbi:MAG: 1-deoxy-D-xylulose-5-phosphate synthase, partial [Gammaproteobacteria bacterium]